jgi:hypothetical protein
MSAMLVSESRYDVVQPLITIGRRMDRHDRPAKAGAGATGDAAAAERFLDLYRAIMVKM